MYNSTHEFDPLYLYLYIDMPHRRQAVSMEKSYK